MDREKKKKKSISLSAYPGRVGDRICGSTGELCNPMKVMKVTASTENEICPAIETWETGNRWLSKGKRGREAKIGTDVRTRWTMEGRVERDREQCSPAHSPLVPQDGTDQQQCQQQQHHHWDDNGGGACREANEREQKKKGGKCVFVSRGFLSGVTYYHWKKQSPLWLLQFHICIHSIPRDTWTHNEPIKKKKEICTF